MLSKRVRSFRKLHRVFSAVSQRTIRWCDRPHLEPLEQRDVFACMANVAAGVLNVSCMGGPDTVILDHSGSSATVVINGGMTQSFADATYMLITVTGGSNGLTTNFRGNIRPLTLFGNHDMDVVNIGDAANQVQNIQAALDLQNQPAWNNVNINDQGDLTSRTAMIDVVPIGGLPYQQVTGLGSAAINCKVNDTRSVTINTSSAGSTANVLATANFAFGAGTTISQRGGSDVVNVGSGGGRPGTLANINGLLTVYNGPAYSAVNINNQSDPVSHNVTITNAGPGGVSGIAPAAINFTSFSVRQLTVNGGSGTNTYTIASTPATTNVTLNTGTGTNTTNVQANSAPVLINNVAMNSTTRIASTATTLDPIGQVFVNGPGSITLDDSGFASSDDYQLTCSAVSIGRSGSFGVSFQGASALQLNRFSTISNVPQDIFDIDSTCTVTTINAPSGGSRFNLSRFSQSLRANFPSQVILNGGGTATNDFLVLYDQQDPLPPPGETFTFDNGGAGGRPTYVQLGNLATIATFSTMDRDLCGDPGVSGIYVRHATNYTPQDASGTVDFDPSCLSPASPSGRGPILNQFATIPFAAAPIFGPSRPNPLSPTFSTSSHSSLRVMRPPLDPLAVDEFFRIQDKQEGPENRTARIDLNGLWLHRRSLLQEGTDFEPELLPRFALCGRQFVESSLVADFL
jgi:hypothetical protein